MLAIILLVAALALFLARAFGAGGPVHLGWVGLAVLCIHWLVGSVNAVS